MLYPWPTIKILASEILTKLTNLSYVLLLSQAVIAACHPALPFPCTHSSGQRYWSWEQEGELISVCPSYSRRNIFSFFSHLQFKIDYNIWEIPHSSLCSPVSRLIRSLYEVQLCAHILLECTKNLSLYKLWS